VKQAVVLLGGRGTRMWPLTATVPKGLLPVAGVPFIELQLRELTSVGVEQVFLAIGSDHEAAWREYAPATDMAVELSVEDSPLDTAGPVAALLDRLDERFLVLNGDVVLEGSLPGFVDQAPDFPAVLALVEVDDPSAYGVVMTAPDGRVERFVEKPPPGEAPGNRVNAGMYVLERAALAAFPSGSLSFEKDVFPDLVEHGKIGATTIEGDWLDIGTPELYLQAHDAAAAGRIQSVELASSGASWAWISPDARVSSEASVVESVVLPDADIGAGAVLERAVIGWGARIGAATIRGATVVGAGADVGDGCELAAGLRVAPGAVLEAGSVSFSPPD
jgi:NDP-sugar pyrophosphorylase family protein